MKRKVITILEEKCTGCGLCIPNCPEGAIQILNGKARLVSTSLCDGLGACLGHCPEGAMMIEDRESEIYNEKEVLKNIMKHGPEAIHTHLEHLREHKEESNLGIALSFLKEQGADLSGKAKPGAHSFSGCPGSKNMSFPSNPENKKKEGGDPEGRPSQLRHWPIQLHLISPAAPSYDKKDVLLAADCVAYAVGDFHKNYLEGKSLAIACPKLDEGQEIYLEKLVALINDAEINTLTVMTMEVPCCSGLLRLAQTAAAQATRKIPLKHILVSLRGEILDEKWL